MYQTDDEWDYFIETETLKLLWNASMIEFELVDIISNRGISDFKIKYTILLDIYDQILMMRSLGNFTGYNFDEIEKSITRSKIEFNRLRLDMMSDMKT